MFQSTSFPLGLALLVSSAFAGEHCRTVVVLLEGALPGAGAMHRAEHIATKMFASAGVDVRWVWTRGQQLAPDCGGSIRLQFSSGEKGRPGALAYALPYSSSGTSITVMWDRVQGVSGGEIRFGDTLLAHVLVHEITHVLQGVAHHSNVGVMRPRWGNDDYFQMKARGLPFTESDVERMHAGLDRRLARSSPNLGFAAR
jgi:hypothetical protein